MDRKRRTGDKVSRKTYDQVDAFKLNESPAMQQHLKNQIDEYLIAQPENSIACFTPVTNAKGETATFYLHKYRMTDPIGALPVAICCKIEGRNYMLEAEKDSVKLTEKQLPKTIKDNTSKFIFYQRISSTGHNFLRFESSSKEGSYLAWEGKEKKLILKLTKDPIDEHTHFLLDEV